MPGMWVTNTGGVIVRALRKDTSTPRFGSILSPQHRLRHFPSEEPERKKQLCRTPLSSPKWPCNRVPRASRSQPNSASIQCTELLLIQQKCRPSWKPSALLHSTA
ncbi:hypothetical protein Q5P01_017621 [Channa striata]|uniref:Uncharacterized protein n=1 Tax=Channa striata TaxID=64152 RepID=A0AA88MCM3_CHASR|nr:hypothetical protein Q5P01_017621 [Channa striata]